MESRSFQVSLEAHYGPLWTYESVKSVRTLQTRKKSANGFENLNK